MNAFYSSREKNDGVFNVVIGSKVNDANRCVLAVHGVSTQVGEQTMMSPLCGYVRQQHLS